MLYHIRQWFVPAKSSRAQKYVPKNRKGEYEKLSKDVWENDPSYGQMIKELSKR